MTGALTFDGNSLQTLNPTTNVGIVTNDIDYASIPTRVLSLFQLAHSNASIIPYSNYPSKSITISGVVKGSSSADLDARLDTFRSYFNGKDKNLDIIHNGAARRFVCTSNGVSITRKGPLLFAAFEVQLICTIPFGMDTATTVALNQAGRTGGVYSDSHTFLGTAPLQLPVITITLTAVSSTGSQQLSWGNNDNGQGIVITRSNWTAGDVVVIDCVNKTVTVNGVVVDYTGAFPEFSPGAHVMTYSDTFASRTMTENVVYYARYL